MYRPMVTKTIARAGTGENVDNHMQENVGWVLFKTRIFVSFLDIRYHPLNANLGIIYNVQCGLSCGVLLIQM